MEEEKIEQEVEETEEPSIKGKVEFPLAGIIIIGVLGLLMILCIVLIKVL